ncbi:MAG TPA: VOC family protein [Chloroflexota bacterium]
MKITGLTHWSIPVNDLGESERFYSEVLGMPLKGRLGNSNMACLDAGGTDLLLCERNDKVVRTPDQDNRLHHSFTVSPEDWERAAHLFREKGVEVEEIVYREKGFFTGREMYFLDPSGNLLEVRDPTWQPGQPTPTYEEIVGAAV